MDLKFKILTGYCVLISLLAIHYLFFPQGAG